MLQEFSQEKIGLIVNEFSGTGVDGALIRHDIPGASMIELNNGSIFCACIKDSFVDSLIDLAGRNLDLSLIHISQASLFHASAGEPAGPDWRNRRLYVSYTISGGMQG